MNELNKELSAKIDALEKSAENIVPDIYRLKLHLMPKTGWLNDPNGLCQFKGLYHVFFQYSPLDPNGGMKAWGHYTSKDLINWSYDKAVLLPDSSFDIDGVYSGSAFIENDKMYLYYTGNVKQEGEHDYILSGREANTVLAESTDGFEFSDKQLLMTNSDYPDDYTCHIRDPKVWKENGLYYMIQGGRKKGDKGAVLIFSSEDLKSFRFLKEVTSKEPFGYMWECPDYFCVEELNILSVSPQGVDSEKYRYQNIYQSGYFKVEGNITGNCRLYDFTEWDMGFDFYAPQTFLDEKGRRILIGWCGIPDADYDNMPTVERGWQHALTIPRVITVKDKRVFQNPVEELLSLRRDKKEIADTAKPDKDFFELEIEKAPKENCSIVLKETSESDEAVKLIFKDNVLSLELTKRAGRGRDRRCIKAEEVSNIRIIADTSMLEVFINNGEYVMTTRFYFDTSEREIEINGTRRNIMYSLLEMNGVAGVNSL